MGDSRGDHERAARLLAEDAPGVREFLARAERVPLEEAGRRASAGLLAALRDLAAPFSARPAPVRPAE
ncbi:MULTISPECIES: hypothetical protein [Streptomyces]|uniref:hypothetical protein n=1 Tax=Streptomyces TaxID=1883 RepID=UPI001E35187B|nr:MULTISPECIES: hypothetical protein [Streptomyces]